MILHPDARELSLKDAVSLNVAAAAPPFAYQEAFGKVNSLIKGRRDRPIGEESLVNAVKELLVANRLPFMSRRRRHKRVSLSLMENVLPARSQELAILRPSTSQIAGAKQGRVRLPSHQDRYDNFRPECR